MWKRANISSARIQMRPVIPYFSMCSTLWRGEHGLEDRRKLTLAVRKTPAEAATEPDRQTELTTRFLEYACPDH